MANEANVTFRSVIAVFGIELPRSGGGPLGKFVKDP